MPVEERSHPTKLQSNPKPAGTSLVYRPYPRSTLARSLILALLVIIGSLGSTATTAQVEVQGNKGTAYRLFEEVYNAGDMTAANEIISSNAAIHVPSHQLQGAAGCDEYVALLRADFPNARFVVEDTIVSGDTVAVRWTLTNDGDAASSLFGSEASVSGMALLRIENGLIVELWMQ
jgi:predicted ester cyclase